MSPIDWPFEPTEDDRTDAQISVHGGGPLTGPAYAEAGR